MPTPNEKAHYPPQNPSSRRRTALCDCHAKISSYPPTSIPSPIQRAALSSMVSVPLLVRCFIWPKEGRKITVQHVVRRREPSNSPLSPPNLETLPASPSPFTAAATSCVSGSSMATFKMLQLTVNFCLGESLSTLRASNAGRPLSAFKHVLNACCCWCPSSIKRRRRRRRQQQRQRPRLSRLRASKTGRSLSFLKHGCCFCATAKQRLSSVGGKNNSLCFLSTFWGRAVASACRRSNSDGDGEATATLTATATWRASEGQLQRKLLQVSTSEELF